MGNNKTGTYITRKQQKMYFKYIMLQNCFVRSENEAITVLVSQL